MTIFDLFAPKENANEEVEAERGFAREQQATSSGLHPSDDQFFTMQKEKGDDLLRWQQDLGDQLESLKHDLRNEYFDGASDRWQRKTQNILQADGTYAAFELPQLMNEIGISQVETIIRPLLSRNLINSNLTEKTILSLLLNTTETLICSMEENLESWEMEFVNMSNILRMIKNTIIPAPYRALNDGERKHARTMNKRIETFTDNGKEGKEKKGLFG